jgi:hypothetical protein
VKELTDFCSPKVQNTSLTLALRGRQCLASECFISESVIKITSINYNSAISARKSRWDFFGEMTQKKKLAGVSDRGYSISDGITTAMGIMP